MPKKSVRRWRLFQCFEGKDRVDKANEMLEYLQREKFDAKVWKTRPEHETSGHIHIVVLCDMSDLLELGGIVVCTYRTVCERWPKLCPKDFKHGDKTEDYSCLVRPTETCVNLEVIHSA